MAFTYSSSSCSGVDEDLHSHTYTRNIHILNKKELPYIKKCIPHIHQMCVKYTVCWLGCRIETGKTGFSECDQQIVTNKC